MTLWACVTLIVLAFRPEVIVATIALAICTFFVVRWALPPAVSGVRRFTVLAVAISAASIFVYAVYWVTWDPRGIVDDAWGKPVIQTFWGTEQSELISTAANEKGDIVTVRSMPGLIIAPQPIPFFVNLHVAGSSPDSQTLLFRYDGTEDDVSFPPSVKWIDSSHLAITVHHDGRLTVTKMIQEVRGIRVAYAIGKAKYELHFWERPFF